MSAPVTQREVLAALADCDPAAKCRAAATLHARCTIAGFDTGGLVPPAGHCVAGRPTRPDLVAPANLARRRSGGAAGRAALVHAIAHIEFNAINLALDAASRFGGMPEAFYRDWLSVAADEARHFRLLDTRLAGLGCSYGDFPAHDGLWEMAARTAHSCLERMALVPRVLEARGLDVTPGMIERLARAGDAETIAVLEFILEEEVRHVAIGSQWFRFCCAQAGLATEATFLDLLDRHFRGRVKGPLNIGHRRRAGFSERELEALQADA